MPAQDSEQIVRFGAFELDLRARELRRHGIRLPIQGRPLQLLAMLLRSPGRLFTGEELRTELWPADTFVDFEHGIRNAVARLRAVLGDTAEKPRFIETLPRRGYRFIGVVEAAAAAPTSVAAPHRNRLRIAAIALTCLLVAGGLGARIYSRAHGIPAEFQITSLAVLPLENLSSDSTQDYFVDGITDELITALAKINSVKVISRTSVMQYKGTRKPLPRIARELGVDGVVEGTVVRSGDRVRMTAQLIYASADRHIWAERYERSVRDILLVENDIARAIAERLRGKLDSQQARRFTARPIDSAAHEAYLQGRYLWNKRSWPALQGAIRSFEEAIEKEPRFALAYAGLADAYAVFGSWGAEAIAPEEAFPKAKAAAEKALQLDETSAEAHTARANIRQLYEWDWQGAETEFQRAIELNPNYAPAHQWYGVLLCELGRFEECISETARAHALDPFYFVAAVDVGHRLYLARRYPEAIVALQKTLEFDSNSAGEHLYLGLVYEASRRYKEAVVELRRVVQLSGGRPVHLAALGHAYAVSGQRTEARELLQNLEQLAKESYVSAYGIALIYVGLGEKDRALESLERAFRRGSPWMVFLKVDPRLDPLRTDPRFVELTRRVGLTS